MFIVSKRSDGFVSVDSRQSIAMFEKDHRPYTTDGGQCKWDVLGAFEDWEDAKRFADEATVAA